MRYRQGTTVRFIAKFYVDGVLTDPDVVTFKARPPSGVAGEETLTYPHARLTRTGTGVYVARLLLAEGATAGGTTNYLVQFKGTGAAEGVWEDVVDVEPTLFV